MTLHLLPDHGSDAGRTAPARRTDSPSLPVFLFPLALAACALGSCGGPGGHGGFQMPPVPVEVADVQSRTVKDQFRAVGTVESDEIIQVVSELNATVTRLDFAEGLPVQKGALLAQLDDREFRAAALRAEAQRELAQANAERAQKLIEQQAISGQELDNARTNLKVAEANESLAKTQLAKTRITAPFHGLVGRRAVSQGAYLKSGDVITDLARVDEMKVSFSAPERYLGDLKRGIPVEVSTPALPGHRFLGTVSVVVPVVDANTRTIQIVARLPNPERLLRPGMSADVAVTFSERPNALVVPDEAVFAEGNQSFVYVVKPDSTVSRAAVEIGTRDSMRVEVTRGLAAGSQVVKAGHQKLFEGAHVMPIPEEAMGGAGGPGGPGGGGGAAAGGAKPRAGDGTAAGGAKPAAGVGATVGAKPASGVGATAGAKPASGGAKPAAAGKSRPKPRSGQ
jgi:membrane fusion protein, multidrug efflux system